MYNHHLRTFVVVADSGSFMKAAEDLYISANAVAKQITLLESELSVRLFDRSTRGLRLTEAGRFLYSEACKLIRYSEDILEKARSIEKSEACTIHVGVSIMNSAAIIADKLKSISSLHPEYRIEASAYDDTPADFMRLLETLGSQVDLVFCPYDTNHWGDRYASLKLLDLDFCITMRQTHSLAGRSALSWSELHGYTLVLLAGGISVSCDALREYLQLHHPQIRLESVEYMDMELFNRIASSDRLLLSAECWSRVHPMLSTIPVYGAPVMMPYGAIYSRYANDVVLSFLSLLAGEGQRQEDLPLSGTTLLQHPNIA